MMLFMVLCLSGCSEDISEFNIFEYGYNFVEDKIEENRKKSEDAVDQLKENAEGALHETIDGYVGILKNRQKKDAFAPSSGLRELIISAFSNCNHDVPVTLNEEEKTISCECGKNVISSELYEFVTASSNAFNDPSRASEISNLTSSMENLCKSSKKKISNTILKNNSIRLSRKEKEFLTNNVEFLNTSAKILEAVSMAIDVYEYDNEVAENGQSLKTVDMQVKLFQKLTKHIPVYGKYFGKMLSTVSKGLKVLDEANKISLTEHYVTLYTLNVSQSRVKDNEIINFYQIGSKVTWDQGPSLKALSDAKDDGRLSDEEITILSPYITYRFEQEFANCTALDLMDNTIESTDTTDTE